MKPRKTIFSGFSDGPTKFQIDSEYICIGTFENAMEGALRWQLAKKANALSSLGPDDLCVRVEPGQWNVYADEDDKGGLFWHDALAPDKNEIARQWGNWRRAFLHDIDILFEYDNATYQIYRYGWGTLRNIRADSELTARLLQEGVEQSYLDAIDIGVGLLDCQHCFFVPPQNILELMPIVENKYELMSQRAKKYNDELQAIYAAESFDQAQKLLEECESSWVLYRHLLDNCRLFWKKYEYAQTLKKTSKKYQKLLHAHENFEYDYYENYFIDDLDHYMSNEKRIGVLKGQGVNMYWESDYHWTGSLYFDTSSDIPKLVALDVRPH